MAACWMIVAVAASAGVRADDGQDQDSGGTHGDLAQEWVDAWNSHDANAVAALFTSDALSTSTEMSKSCTGAKLIFVLYCRADITHEECIERWNDRQHTRLVKRIPHLVKHVRNATVQLPFAGATDGIGELWFPSAAQMDAALNSLEFNAAVLDAQRFLDLGKTYAIVVNEIAVIDRTRTCSKHER